MDYIRHLRRTHSNSRCLVAAVFLDYLKYSFDIRNDSDRFFSHCFFISLLNVYFFLWMRSDLAGIHLICKKQKLATPIQKSLHFHFQWYAFLTARNVEMLEMLENKITTFSTRRREVKCKTILSRDGWYAKKTRLLLECLFSVVVGTSEIWFTATLWIIFKLIQ